MSSENTPNNLENPDNSKSDSKLSKCYRVDLHTHSNCSDGILTPEQLIDKAIQSGIEIFSITDHDCISAYQKINIANYQSSNFRLITGIEFSSVWAGIGIHVVGLNVDLNSSDLLQLIAQQSAARIRRIHKICHKLQKLNLEIDADAFVKSVNESEYIDNAGNKPQIGRPHLARYLVETGQVKSVSEAFRKYLGAAKAGDIKDDFASLEQIIATVRAAGGKAVIAHPNNYKITRTKLLLLLDDFIALKGSGMEIVSGNLNRDIINNNISIVRQKKLLSSIGSDYHGMHDFQTNFGRGIELPNDLDLVWEDF